MEIKRAILTIFNQMQYELPRDYWSPIRGHIEGILEDIMRAYRGHIRGHTEGILEDILRTYWGHTEGKY